MIIDDEHRVAFVHIPKCGGTSVRHQLQPLDSYQGFFYDRRDHDRLGAIDYCHIPLAFLESDFPSEFEKLARYQSFALVRDPHARFASATFERLALFGGVRRTTATARMAIHEAEQAMRWLERRGPFCEAGYIHFARQIDYVALAGRRVVHNVFALEDMAGFGAELKRLTGAGFDPGRRENTNFASPSRLLTLLHVAKPIYSRVTAWEQREKLLKLLHRWKLQSPDTLYAELRGHPKISAFVESYYSEDFALYAAAKAGMAGARTPGNPEQVARQTVGAEQA